MTRFSRLHARKSCDIARHATRMLTCIYVGTYVSGIVCFFVKPGVYCRRRLALRVFRDRRTLIMCRAFNTNLVFMRRKKVEVGRGKQDKSMYLTMELYFCTSTLLLRRLRLLCPVVRFDSVSLSAPGTACQSQSSDAALYAALGE